MHHVVAPFKFIFIMSQATTDFYLSRAKSRLTQEDSDTHTPLMNIVRPTGEYFRGGGIYFFFWGGGGSDYNLPSRQGSRQP